MTKHAIKAVTATPTILSPLATHSGVDLVIQNNSGIDAYIGASTVSISDYGFKIAAGSAISLRLGGNDEIYAVVDGSANINVLTVGLA